MLANVGMKSKKINIDKRLKQRYTVREKGKNPQKLGKEFHMDNITFENLLKTQSILEYVIHSYGPIVDQTRIFFIDKQDGNVNLKLTTVDHLNNSTRESNISVNDNNTTYHNIEFMHIDKVHVNKFLKDLKLHYLGKKIFDNGVKDIKKKKIS